MTPAPRGTLFSFRCIFLYKFQARSRGCYFAGVGRIAWFCREYPEFS